MPKFSRERVASDFIKLECFKAIPKDGQFIGYVSDISDEGKVTVNAFYTMPGKPDAALCVKVNSRDVLRAVINPASVPMPTRDKPEATAPASAPAKGKTK